MNLTLQCNFTNDEIPAPTSSLVINTEFMVRRDSIDGATNYLVANLTIFRDGRASTAFCRRNWVNECEISYDESSNDFAGSLTASHRSYDSSVETGLFFCEVCIHGVLCQRPTIDIRGNLQKLLHIKSPSHGVRLHIMLSWLLFSKQIYVVLYYLKLEHQKYTSSGRTRRKRTDCTGWHHVPRNPTLHPTLQTPCPYPERVSVLYEDI